YQLVDRAGMGVQRMGVRSLVYGRAFPSFEESEDAVKVTMRTEYLRPGIFILTEGKPKLYIPDLIILNVLYERTHVPIHELLSNIRKTAREPWQAVLDFIERWGQFVEFCGDKEDVYIRVLPDAKEYFNTQTLF